MVDVRELLEYNHIVRRRYFESIARLSWNEFTKNREASFNSIRNIFVHTLGAVDYWLDFLQKENLHSKREFDEYRTFDEVRTYMEHVEKRMRDYLHSLSPEGLEKKYTVTGEDHKAAKITAEDVLIHVFEEEVHHRGELIALLWQMGIDPPEMGWKGL
ncbi:DinB family protein [Candidatus Bathyarchaeota archaeon]|nr:DinB family protein [Candidatus Bathyarchaeota archaeon]